MTTDTAGSVSAYALDLAQALQEYRIDIALAPMGPPLAAQQHVAARRIKNLTVVLQRLITDVSWREFMAQRAQACPPGQLTRSNSPARVDALLRL